MAAKKSSNQIWTVVGLVVLGYLAYKFFFSGTKKTTGNPFGGGGVGGADVGAGQYPNQSGLGALLAALLGQKNQQQQGKPSASVGGGPSSSAAGGAAAAGRNFINSILNYGWSAAQGIPVTTDNFLGQVDAQGIPLEPLQNLTDLPSWSANDPNAPWNQTGSWDSSIWGPSENSIDLGTIDSSYVPQTFDFGSWGQDPSYFDASSSYDTYSGGGGHDSVDPYSFDSYSYEPDYSSQMNG